MGEWVENAFEVAAATRIGGRSENQDDCAWAMTPSGLMLVLADGMGGMPGGGPAARGFVAAMNALVARRHQALAVDGPEVLWGMVRSAGETMVKQVGAKDPTLDPHTTGVACWLDAAATVVANVGDSRAYRLSPNGATWRTRDHTHLQEMVDRGELTEDEARHHPWRNVILRSIGPGKLPEPEVDLLPPLVPGEAILLCSDGFWEHAREEHMIELLLRANLAQSLEKLLDEVTHRAGPWGDNATVLIARRRESR